MLNFYEYYAVDWEATADNINTIIKSQAKVIVIADYLCLTDKQLRNLKNGGSKIDLEDLILISKIFQIRLDELIILKKDMKKYDDKEIEEKINEVVSKSNNAKEINKRNNKVLNTEEDVEWRLIESTILHNENIETLEEFLLYLPLFPLDALVDFLNRAIGNWGNNRVYVQQQLKRLFAEIPNDEAKKYADEYRKFYLETPTINNVTDETKNERKLQKLDEWHANFFDIRCLKIYKSRYLQFIDGLRKLDREGK